MSNFFLIYRPFHYEYTKTIIENHFAADENILVNHYDSNYSVTPEIGIKEVLNLSRSILDRASEVKSVKKRLLKTARTGEIVNVFVPHTLGILSNYSFYRLAKRYKNVNIHVFYEGVIVFYNYDHNYLTNLKYYASRWLLSFLSGIRYTINKRLLNFYDDRIKSIYTPFINIDAPAQKIIETGLRKIDFIPKKEICVILGLPIGKKHDEELRRIVLGIYKKCDELNISRVFLKDHPSHKSEMFHIVAAELGIKIEIIHDTTPIEGIIQNYLPAYVFSIWSSGLINLSNMLPSSINIYSFVTHKITENPEVKKMINVFEKTSINVVYV